MEARRSRGQSAAQIDLSAAHDRGDGPRQDLKVQQQILPLERLDVELDLRAEQAARRSAR
jgi:hypothetical protein